MRKFIARGLFLTALTIIFILSDDDLAIFIFILANSFSIHFGYQLGTQLIEEEKRVAKLEGYNEALRFCIDFIKKEMINHE